MTEDATEELEPITAEAETTEPEAELQDAAPEAEAEPEDADDSVIVSIGDEEPHPEDEDAQPAPAWVKELRQQNREMKRRLREYEQGQTAQAKRAEVGPKPTLESCDYDAEKFEAELFDWSEKKRAADEEAKRQREEEDAAQAEWNGRLTAYDQAKKSLKVRDYDDAEDAVRETLSVTQQGMILQGAENPALLVYALGKNPKIAKELASIKDPVKFAFAVARTEAKLRVSPRKPAIAPEKSPSATGRPSGALTNLDKLREEADRTGDWSRYFEAKRKATKP